MIRESRLACALGSEESGWEEGEAASHLSDGNSVFHLIQKMMKGGFLELGCCAFLPRVAKGCGVCGPCGSLGQGQGFGAAHPPTGAGVWGKPTRASWPGRVDAVVATGPDVRRPLPAGVRTCTGRPETRSASTTCATTRLAPASTRRTRVATAPRTGRTAPSPTALWTCGRLCVTSGEWLSYQEPLCSPGLRLHLPPVALPGPGFYS